MAIEYILRIATDLDSVQITDLLVQISNLQRAENSNLHGDSVVVTVFPENDLGRSIIEDAFGFVSGMCVFFRIDKNHIQEGVFSVLHAIDALLKHTSADLVLLFNGEYVVFMRKSGKLILNSRTDFWNPERLSKMTSPYVMQSIPSL